MTGISTNLLWHKLIGYTDKAWDSADNQCDQLFFQSHLWSEMDIFILQEILLTKDWVTQSVHGWAIDMLDFSYTV